MFTGIIREKGKIKSINKTDKGLAFHIEAKEILNKKQIGDSIACNGVCTTISNITEEGFEFIAMPETLNVSNFGDLKIGDELNLEAALTMQQALDGHFVQGHIDSIGLVEALTTEGEKSRLKIKYPLCIQKYLSLKGSITINGVSLTISDLAEKYFIVDLIPHTLERTNLANLKQGDKVNLEADMIAKYLENLLYSRENQAKFEYLKERGFI